MSDRQHRLSLQLRILALCFFGAAAPFALAGQDFEVNLVNIFGGPGSGPGQFNFPLGIIVNSQDQIIIADAGNNRIQICDHQGNCEVFGSGGTFAGKFRNPHGVAVDSQDRIYTVETGNNRVQIFDSTGNWIRMFGDWGAALGQFKTPGDIAIDKQGRILVADEQNYRVQICSATGQCTAFGSKGTAPGEFDWPRAIVVDSKDTIIVTDRFNHRVQLCDEQGNCDVFGSQGPALGQFEGPVEVALDSQERIIIADRDNHRVQVCDRQGDCWAFGSFGSGPGQFNQPLGVAVDSHDRIIVADNGNNRIQIFEVVSTFQINAGHAGAWFSPETSGQGQFIDVEPEKQFMFVAWFTYTDAASDHPFEQRWLTAQGNYSGNTAQLDLFETLGGQFDDPQMVTTTQIGEVSLSFDDCGQGQMTYSLDAEELQGSFPLLRVIPGSGNVCEERSGSSPQAVDINAGMDGAWFDPNTSGQGFFIDAHPDPEGGNFIFVSWFTYGEDTASGLRWLTAQGSFEGSIAEIDVFETTGGSFDDPQPISTIKVGTMSLDFTDCSNALLTYSLPAHGAEGDIAITRVIPGGQALCEELAGAK